MYHIVLFLFFIAQAISVQTTNFSYWDTFEAWKTHFGIAYQTRVEELGRYKVWEHAYLVHGSSGLNPFSDLTLREREAKFPSIDDIFASELTDEPKYPYTPLKDEYVQMALKHGIDWRSKQAVTTPKNQGPHGYCGTFSRVSAAESQYFLGGGGANIPGSILNSHTLTNFSVEQLVDCVGWAKDQKPSFFHVGFESWTDYPFNISKYNDSQPPPCVFDETKVIPETLYTNFTTVPKEAGEDQVAAFIYRNGPVQSGIYAEVFSNVDDEHFIVASNCTTTKGINHSINIVGFGEHPTKGSYWIIKNSWSSTWQDHGFIYMARNVNCGNITQAGASVFTYGAASNYYDE